MTLQQKLKEVADIRKQLEDAEKEAARLKAERDKLLKSELPPGFSIRYWHRHDPFPHKYVLSHYGEDITDEDDNDEGKEKLYKAAARYQKSLEEWLARIYKNDKSVFDKLIEEVKK